MIPILSVVILSFISKLVDSQKKHCFIIFFLLLRKKDKTIEFLKEKHFVCSKCGMNFTDRNTMTTHEKSHEEKKIYKCDKCGKTFHEARKLQKHIPEHFKCDICGTKFNSEANLTSHKKTKHER